MKPERTRILRNTGFSCGMQACSIVAKQTIRRLMAGVIGWFIDILESAAPLICIPLVQMESIRMAGQDDVTLEGVNDGFHWKATWPAGRLVLRVGVGLALGVCLLGFVWPLRFVLPIGGMILCGAVVIGCQLLMHPGRVSRNQPLQFYAFVAAVAFCAFFVVLLFGIWRSRDIIWSRLGGRTRRG